MSNIIIKFNNKKLIVLTVCIIIALISAYGYKVFEKKSKTPDTQPVSYNDLIASGNDKSNMYVSVDIADIPYQIAQREVNYSYIKYYILYDQNDCMYLAELSDETYNRINDRYKENKDNFSYTLTGYIYETPKDLKEVIIDVFNESITSTKISTDNFADYFGSTYFDDKYTKYTTQTAILEIIAIVSAIAGVIFFAQCIIYIVNTKKTLSKIDKEELESELSKTTLKEYKKVKIYLTDKYLISTYMGLKVFKYTDIVWLYAGNNARFSSQDKMHINICMNDKSKYKTAKIHQAEKYILNEIIDEISSRNSNILAGYSYENMNKYKKIIYR